MQLNPNQISDLIRSRIQGLEETKSDSSDRIVVNVILDGARVSKVTTLCKSLDIESRAETLSLAIDLTADLIDVIQSGGRVIVETKTGIRRYLTLTNLE